MKESTKKLKGSAYRDAVLHWHKSLGDDLYISDIDLVLVELDGDVLKAVIDVKSLRDDNISTTQEALYGWFIKHGIDVYLLTCLSSTTVFCEHCGRTDVFIDADTNVKLTNYATGQVKFFTKTEYVAWERKKRGLT